MTAQLALALILAPQISFAHAASFPSGCQGSVDAAEVGSCACDADYELWWSGYGISSCAG